MRIWVKIYKDTRLLQDVTIEDESDDTRTKKVFRALEEACKKFDLAVPMWLETNIDDFQRRAKTRFTQDSFIETVEFDYMEFHVIEEDPMRM